MLFSEPKIPQLATAQSANVPHRSFQCSSASRKFLNIACVAGRAKRPSVSVLFSEPKIPQSRAWVSAVVTNPTPFQCSSASRKFLNRIPGTVPSKPYCVSVLFSEPKIPQSKYRYLAQIAPEMFQCSSASRKFLNRNAYSGAVPVSPGFQCSSASRKFLNTSSRTTRRCAATVSVLFSEPKIPQCHQCTAPRRNLPVSVLFSEPKIPQCRVSG